MSGEQSLREKINQWCELRGFRPGVSFAEATSTNNLRRVAKVPGLYVLIFKNEDVFVGMANDFSTALQKQPEEWHEEISEVRLMPRSKSGLALVNEAVQLQQEAQKQGFKLPQLPDNTED